MKIDPGFLNHWKTEHLMELCGPAGVVALLRLWGAAQIKREWRGLHLSPRRLQMETKWKGDADVLWDALTDPDAPWLDQDEDGTWSLHGFAEHQKQVIHLWKAGGKGGRPKKENTNSNSTYSSSSSYPISEPIENHMVSKPKKQAKKEWTPDETQCRLNAIFHRRDTTEWSEKEKKAFRAANIDVDDLAVVERYYATDADDKFHRTALATMLNNWSSEVDKARNYQPANQARNTNTPQG